MVLIVQLFCYKYFLELFELGEWWNDGIVIVIVISDLKGGYFSGGQDFLVFFFGGVIYLNLDGRVSGSVRIVIYSEVKERYVVIK